MRWLARHCTKIKHDGGSTTHVVGVPQLNYSGVCRWQKAASTQKTTHSQKIVRHRVCVNLSYAHVCITEIKGLLKRTQQRATSLAPPRYGWKSVEHPLCDQPQFEIGRAGGNGAPHSRSALHRNNSGVTNILNITRQ